jgi:hypothetical protein
MGDNSEHEFSSGASFGRHRDPTAGAHKGQPMAGRFTSAATEILLKDRTVAGRFRIRVKQA